MNDEQLFATRRSIVERLGDWRDQKNWQRFFDTYWRLIYSVARKAGLTEDEAQEVVQETAITVAKNAGNFHYDPKIGSFRGWLLQTTRWRIADQFRKRQPLEQHAPESENDSRTRTIERIRDDQSWEEVWDSEWRSNLLHAAMERLKQSADAKQFQIFDCYVIKGWPAPKVAKQFGVSRGQVYLIRFRLGALLKKEIERLEKSEF